MGRKENEACLDKLRLLSYYNEPKIIQHLERLAVCRVINVPLFCSTYIKDSDTNEYTFACQLIQYVVDKNLEESIDVQYACEAIIGYMNVVDAMVAVARKGLKLTDIINCHDPNIKFDGLDESDIWIALANYMLKNNLEIKGLRFEVTDKHEYRMYYNGERVQGAFDNVVSFNIIDDIVMVSYGEDATYYTYYLGDTPVLEKNMTQLIEEDDDFELYEDYEEYHEYGNYEGYDDYE